jgi:hypothetical protein
MRQLNTQYAGWMKGRVPVFVGTRGAATLSKSLRRRDYLRRWRNMGKEYLAMLDLVRWRKAVGRREVVALNENVLLERAPPVDYPGLLADVLDGLLSMTEENWRERCGELAELLRMHSAD